MRKILSLSVFLACAFFIYSYIRGHLADFSVISGISLPYLLPIGCATFACLVVNGLFVKIVTGSFGIDLDFSEHFSISVLTSFGNLFLPMKGGAGIRAVYLKTRHGLDYSYFLSGLGANYLIVFSVCSVAALACLALLYFSAGTFNLAATLVFLSVAALSLWAIAFPAPWFSWLPTGWLRERAELVMSGWRIIRKDKKAVTRLYGLGALNLLTGFVAAWLEFSAFGMKDGHGNGIGFVQAAIFFSIGSMSVIISVTPSALGIRETLLMFCSRFLGITPAQALAVSLLDRSINALLVCLLFFFASVQVNRRLKREEVQSLPEDGQ